MTNKVLVFIEQRNGEIKKSSFEAAKLGSRIAAELNVETEAIIVGNEINNAAALGNYGIKKVKHFKNSGLQNYSNSAYGEIVAKYIEESGSSLVFFANTAMGKDLAPKISVKMDAGLLMDCIELNYENGNLNATRPVYAGKVLLEVKLKSDKKVFTLRPNVFNIGEVTDTLAEVEVVEVDSINLSSKAVEIKKSEGKLDVAEAEIIVSGGRGLKEADNFKLVEDLAETLGAAVGASRAVVDAGWRPHSEQVGQTGKTVSPTLYVACGISGAIQHLAGMRSSKYIVAINKDKDAPIFQVADYGITGDVFEILPILNEEIKKVKA